MFLHDGHDELYDHLRNIVLLGNRMGEDELEPQLSKRFKQQVNHLFSFLPHESFVSTDLLRLSSESLLDSMIAKRLTEKEESVPLDTREFYRMHSFLRENTGIVVRVYQETEKAILFLNREGACPELEQELKSLAGLCTVILDGWQDSLAIAHTLQTIFAMFYDGTPYPDINKCPISVKAVEGGGLFPVRRLAEHYVLNDLKRLAKKMATGNEREKFFALMSLFDPLLVDYADLSKRLQSLGADKNPVWKGWKKEFDQLVAEMERRKAQNEQDAQGYNEEALRHHLDYLYGDDA